MLTGKSLIRKIENLPTDTGDKPNKTVTITDSGELTDAEAAELTMRTPDATGDPYEDFPEDLKSPPTAAETVKLATEIKGFGNKAFKDGDLALGLEKYQKGIRYINEDPSLDAEPPTTKKDLDALRFTLNSNSALLSIKLKQFEDALKFASAALDVPEITPAEKAKALYRRALAKVGLKDDDDALKDLEEANKLVSNDAAVLKELAAVKKNASDRAKKEKAAYSKFFS